MTGMVGTRATNPPRTLPSSRPVTTGSRHRAAHGRPVGQPSPPGNQRALAEVATGPHTACPETAAPDTASLETAPLETAPLETRAPVRVAPAMTALASAAPATT